MGRQHSHAHDNLQHLKRAAASVDQERYVLYSLHSDVDQSIGVHVGEQQTDGE
jgi:hypothetical protein